MNNYELKGYITNLGLYNEGYLKGAWVTFPLDEDEAAEVLESIGIGETNGFETYEEYFFTEFEQSDNVLNTLELDYENIESINDMVYAIQDLSDYDLELFMAINENETLDISDFDPNEYIFYRGMDLRDVAEEIVGDMYGNDSFIMDYFDYDSYVNCCLSYDYFESDYGSYCRA